MRQQSVVSRLTKAIRLQKRSPEQSNYRYGGKLEQTIPNREPVPLIQSKSVDNSEVDQYIVGYGKLAAVENCDPDFLIYRKFGWLRNCALLYLQDELVELEEDLKALDKFDFENDDRKLVSRRRNDGAKGLGRRELLANIREKLTEYGELAQLQT